MKHAIISSTAPYEIKQSLINKGRELIETVSVDSLSSSVATHADMQLCQINETVFVSSPETYGYYKRIMPNRVTLLKGKTPLESTYPRDIAYNVAVGRYYAFHYKKYIDPVVSDACHQLHIPLIPISQGYARCSIMFVGDGIITSDPSIDQVALANGIDCLSIDYDRNILLPGYDYGFIGGTCGYPDEQTITICGNLGLHKQEETIREFLNTKKIYLESLSSGNIWDIGGILYC